MKRLNELADAIDPTCDSRNYSPEKAKEAAAIRRVSPGAVPENLGLVSTVIAGGRADYLTDRGNEAEFLSDDIARHVLIAAMVMDGRIHRHDGAWVVVKEEPFEGGRRWFSQKAFRDADHGGSLGACYAAWRFAKGIA